MYKKYLVQQSTSSESKSKHMLQAIEVRFPFRKYSVNIEEVHIQPCRGVLPLGPDTVISTLGPYKEHLTDILVLAYYRFYNFDSYIKNPLQRSAGMTLIKWLVQPLL